MLGNQLLPIDSKQLYHLNLEGGWCELSAPDSGLVSYIDYYWLLTIDQPALELEIIPDTAVDLVMSPDLTDFAALYFPTPEPYVIKLQGPVRYVGVCFRSACVAEILGLDFNALSQLKIGVDTLDSLYVSSLLIEIQGITSIGSTTKIFDEFWLTRLDQTHHTDGVQSRISHQVMIDALEDAIGPGNIASICKRLGVSERQFRRLSIDLFGLSPKKLQNILRLQSALEELFNCEPNQLQDWYYDDSHRIRELKRLTGCTPFQIRKMAEKYNNRSA